MSCTNCERAVKNGVGELAGVKNVTVDLSGKTVIIEYNADKATLESFKQVIAEEGFEVVD